MAGSRCLIIDLDPQGNATTGLGAEKRPRQGSHLLLAQPELYSEALVQTDTDNLSLIPSSSNLVEAESEFANASDRLVRLRPARKLLDEEFDFVLIDCPPSSGFFPTNALACYDAVLVPIQCEYYAMEGLTQILSTISRLKQRFNPQLEIEGILMTMYEPSAFADEVVAEVNGHFGESTYKTRIPRDLALCEAPSHGRTILDYDHRSRGARAYIELAKEVLADEQR
jgi:chromosome partitioning protein